MPPHPPRRRQPPVQHLLIQRMPKAILPTHRPIRPRRQPRRLQELPPLRQRLAHRLGPSREVSKPAATLATANSTPTTLAMAKTPCSST